MDVDTATATDVDTDAATDIEQLSQLQMQGRGQGKVFCSHSCANQLQDSITNSANSYTCVQATY